MLKVKHQITDIIMNDENKKLITNTLVRANTLAPSVEINHVLDNNTLDIEVCIDIANLKLNTTAEVLFLLGSIFGMCQVQLQSDTIKLPME